MRIVRSKIVVVLGVKEFIVMVDEELLYGVRRVWGSYRSWGFIIIVLSWIESGERRYEF